MHNGCGSRIVIYCQWLCNDLSKRLDSTSAPCRAKIKALNQAPIFYVDRGRVASDALVTQISPSQMAGLFGI